MVRPLSPVTRNRDGSEAWQPDEDLLRPPELPLFSLPDAPDLAVDPFLPFGPLTDLIPALGTSAEPVPATTGLADAAAALGRAVEDARAGADLAPSDLAAAPVTYPSGFTLPPSPAGGDDLFASLAGAFRDFDGMEALQRLLDSDWAQANGWGGAGEWPLG